MTISNADGYRQAVKYSSIGVFFNTGCENPVFHSTTTINVGNVPKTSTWNSLRSWVINKQP